MDFFNITRTFRVLIVFSYFCCKSNSLTLSDLNRVCVYYFPFEIENRVIAPPPNFCTAVATYGDYGFHPPDENFNTVSFKGSLPYVYIYDGVITLQSMKININKHNIDTFVTRINQLISDKNIDVLVIDIANTEFDNDHSYSEKFQYNLKSFFKTMKATHPNMLFGLKINRNAALAIKVFNPDIIDDHVDFYVIRSFDYKHCKYKNDAGQMANPPTSQQLQTTITDLNNVGFDVSKMFLTIQVDVKTYKNSLTPYPKNWSYSWLCRSDPGKDRRFCRGTLNNFYHQGKVVFDNNLPGAFIEAIDCDDYEGNCLCRPFPAAHVILEGMNGYSENTVITGCHTFGLLPRERRYN